MRIPTFGFHVIPFSEFNEQIEYKLSVNEIDSKIESIYERDRSAKLYFGGQNEQTEIDKINRNSPGIFTAVARVSLIDCVYLGRGGHEVMFLGREPGPGGLSDALFKVAIDKQGAFLPANPNLKLGFFTDDHLHQELGKEAIEVGIIEIETFLAQQQI